MHDAQFAPEEFILDESEFDPGVDPVEDGEEEDEEVPAEELTDEEL